MKLWIFLATILGSACATPTYVTKHGLNVYDLTTVIVPAQNDVERVTDYTIKHLGHAEKLCDTDVMLINKWIQIPRYKKSGYNLADGHTNIWDKRIIVSVFQTCLADSGLFHELAHIIHDYDAQVPDWWHDDVEFWLKIKRLEKQIIKELCPSDFVRVDIKPDYVPARL